MGRGKESFRKLEILSLSQRMEVIRLSQQGISQRNLAEKFKCGKTQIQNTLANKQRFIEEWHGNSVNRLYKRRRNQPNREVNNQVLLWYRWAESNNVLVTGPMLQEKAREIATQMNVSGFSASNGWLESFRKRHGIALNKRKFVMYDFIGVEESHTPECNQAKTEVEAMNVAPSIPISGSSASVINFNDSFLPEVPHQNASIKLQQAWEVPQQLPTAPQTQSVTPQQSATQPQKLIPPPQLSAPKPIAPKPPPPQPVSPLQPAPPEVCLRWNSYHSNMQATFPSLLNNEQFVDVTLACEGRSIKCHKMMLSACSAYFEELLSQNPCQHPIVLMKDLRYWEVQALVDFMYRGEVNVGQDKLPSLLAAAEALQIKGLAGPASSSSHGEETAPAPAPMGSAEDYLEESAPSPASARRARKRRVMNAVPSPRSQSVQSQPPQQSQLPAAPPTRSGAGKQRLIRPAVSMPSTSNYEHESAASSSSEPPTRRAKKEIKIEPIDIEISNDSMDHIDDSFMDKVYDESEAGDGGESSCQGDDPGGTGETSKGTTSRTNMHGQDSDQMDFGDNNGISTANDQNFQYDDSGPHDDSLPTVPDIPGTSFSSAISQPSGSGINSGGGDLSDNLLGHM